LPRMRIAVAIAGVLAVLEMGRRRRTSERLSGIGND